MRRLLFLTLLFSLNTNASVFNLKVKIDEFNFSPENYKTFERKTSIGNLNVSLLDYQTDDIDIGIGDDDNGNEIKDADKERLESNISIDHERLYFKIGPITFKPKTSLIPGLDNIKSAHIGNVFFETDDEVFQIKGVDDSRPNYGDFEIDDYSFGFMNLGLYCGLKENIKDNSEDLALSCLNDSILTTSVQNSIDFPNAKVNFNNENLEVTANINKGGLGEDQFFLRTSDLKTETSESRFYSEQMTLTCSKVLFDKNTSFDQVFAGCLKQQSSGQSSVLDAPLIKYYDKTSKLQIDVETRNFRADGETLQYNAALLKLKNEGHDANLKDINLNCPLPEIGETYSLPNLFDQCLTNSVVDFGALDYKFEDQQVNLRAGSKLILNENDYSFETPRITYRKDDDLIVTVERFGMNCTRSGNVQSIKDVNARNIMTGCFDTSDIKLEALKFENPTIDLNVSIDKIELDKNRIEFYSPKGSYMINERKTKYEEITFNCDLDVNYDLAANLDWRSILENCIHSTKFSIDEIIKDKKKGKKNPWWRLDKHVVGLFTGVIKKLINLEVARKITFDSKVRSGDKFIGTIKPKFLQFGRAPIEFKGSINFNENTNQIEILLGSVRYRKIFPVKFLVMFIIEAFVPGDSIHTDGSRILIDVAGDKAQTPEIITESELSKDEIKLLEKEIKAAYKDL
jgi:hypothetical protein